MPVRERSAASVLVYRPLDGDSWPAFVALFGPKGACAGCWCMFWRLTRSTWEAGRGDANKRRMHALVRGGASPGVLAMHGDEAVGWCAFAPRAEYGALARSRVLAPVDDRDVWSVSCFFVKREWRGQGVSVGLLREAARLARARGARVLEGYPVEPAADRAPAAFVWTGLASAFRAAGFREVARRSSTRPIMRRELRALRGTT